MEKLFEITERMHAIYQKVLLETPKEQLFLIPPNHNNHLFWNIAHVLVTEQSLFYRLSNLTPRLDMELIKKYSKGTFPEGIANMADVKAVSEALPLTPKWVREDYQKGIFTSFNPYTTSTGVTLNSLEEAVTFNLVHLGLHYGTILSMKKQLKGS